jgi:hypothetical protein
LAGDFNARTAELKDFSVFTENDFPNGGEYLLENYISFLTDSNLPLNRKNIDKGKNKFGKLLINLCKGQNLFSMNGRVGSDSNIGELTCKNASAVDYFICSPNFIKCINDLTVLGTRVRFHFPIFRYLQCVLYFLKHLYHYHSLQKHCFKKLY